MTDGDLVRVEVVRVREDGTAMLRVAGVAFEAAWKDLPPEGSLLARVSVRDGTVFLIPERPDAPRPGVPETGVESLLARFLAGIGEPAEPARVARLARAASRAALRTASRNPARAGRAAIAAAMLDSRGIEPTEERVSALVDCLEGRCGSEPGDPDGGGDRQHARDDSHAGDGSRDRDFLALVNAKKGGRLHWVVVPFHRELAGEPCRGSARFLIDLETGSVRETAVIANVAGRDWEFRLVDGKLETAADPPFPPVVFDGFIVYLNRILEASPVRAVAVSAAPYRPVDVEA
jgi:hypothetical protein